MGVDKYMLIGVGSPSDLKELEKPSQLLGGRNIFEYIEEKGINQLEKPLKVSCHRTLDRAIGYANDLQSIASSGNPIVAVLAGGLSLALPGIVTSQTTTLPVIGVPFYATGMPGTGLDSTTAVYNLPPGTVQAGVPMHVPDESPSIDKAVRLAVRMLSPMDRPLLIGPKDAKQTKTAADTLDSVDMGYDYREGVSLKENIGAALNIAAGNGALMNFDQSAELAVQCRVPYRSDAKKNGFLSMFGAQCSDYIDMLFALSQTRNTVYTGHPKNAALFLARVASLYDKDVRQKLQDQLHDKKIDTQTKYGDKLRLSIYSFKGGKKDEAC